MKLMLGVAALAPTVFFLLGFLFLVWPVRKNKTLRYLMLLLAVIASYKTLFFLVFGGSVMAPDLPAWLQLWYGILQNTYFFMLGLAVTLGPILLIGRRVAKARILSTGAFMSIIAVLGAVLGVTAGLNAVAAPKVDTYRLTAPKFAQMPEGYRIVQLSDLHMGINITPQMIKQIVQMTNAQKPDLVVITGDLVDGMPEKLRSDVSLLADLKAKDGVYIINGNHEYYASASAWEEVWGDYGLNLLNNKNVILKRDGVPFLAVAGLADKQAIKVGNEAPNLAKALKGIPSDLPIVLLEHRPENFKTNASKVDLMLSGHTHGGMVWGLDYLVAFLNGGYVSGLYHEGTSSLIVSRGTYLWGGFLARLGTTGEIGVITFSQPKNSKDQESNLGEER